MVDVAHGSEIRAHIAEIRRNADALRKRFEETSDEDFLCDARDADEIADTAEEALRNWEAM